MRKHKKKTHKKQQPSLRARKDPTCISRFRIEYFPILRVMFKLFLSESKIALWNVFIRTRNCLSLETRDDLLLKWQLRFSFSPKARVRLWLLRARTPSFGIWSFALSFIFRRCCVWETFFFPHQRLTLFNCWHPVRQPRSKCRLPDDSIPFKCRWEMRSRVLSYFPLRNGNPLVGIDREQGKAGREKLRTRPACSK